MRKISHCESQARLLPGCVFDLAQESSHSHRASGAFAEQLSTGLFIDDVVREYNFGRYDYGTAVTGGQFPAETRWNQRATTIVANQEITTFTMINIH